MIDFQQLFTSFSTVRIGVIGDVMLDTYVWGKVERISPEAPVPVVTMKGKEYRIGGAGNVALNCSSLGAQVNIISVTGDDKDAVILKELLLEKNIDTSYMITAGERITTNKTRIISRNQQMMRLDAEITADLGEVLEAALLEKIQLFIENEKPEIIIFEDYNKGVLTKNIINQVIILCRQKGIVVAVDPKQKNFLSYKGADIFKPNLKEVREGLNIHIDSINETMLREIHKELTELLNHKISLITLSEKGIFYQYKEESKILPSHIRNISDVSGAGDTVIAVASLVYAVTKNAQLMAEIANIAGGLVCEQVGTVAIDKELLLKECQLLIS